MEADYYTGDVAELHLNADLRPLMAEESRIARQEAEARAGHASVERKELQFSDNEDEEAVVLAHDAAAAAPPRPPRVAPVAPAAPVAPLAPVAPVAEAKSNNLSIRVEQELQLLETRMKQFIEEIRCDCSICFVTSDVF